VCRFQIHEDLRERMLTHTKTLPAIRILVETLKHRLDVRPPGACCLVLHERTSPHEPAVDSPALILQNDLPPVQRPPKELTEEVDDGEAMEGGALFATDDDEF
jgi:hypothetical protein